MRTELLAFRNFRLALCRVLFGLGSGLVVSCGGSDASGPALSSPPRPAPPVVEVVRHYAGQLARGTRLTTAASRTFADSVASLGPNNGFGIDLGTCVVEGWTDSLQCLSSVHLLAPYAQLQRAPNLALPNPALLLRLGALRRAFGPGTSEADPPLTVQEGSRCYPVIFLYQPVPGRQVELRACLPTANYADSARVNSLSIYPRP